MKKLTFILSLLLLPLVASADPVEIDGIWYNLVSRVKTMEVTKNPDENIKYSGSIEIPATVSYNGDTYSVTIIGDKAFYSCRGLTSVTLPNSVTISVSFQLLLFRYRAARRRSNREGHIIETMCGGW